MKAFFDKLSRILYAIAGAICTFILAALCLIIVYSVISRALFNKPVGWQYELTLVGLCWATFIGMSLTFRMEEHLRLTFVTNKLRPGVWKIYMDAIDLLLIVFLITGIVCSIPIIKSTWLNVYKTIPISNGIFYLSFPIGCLFSIVHLVNHILHRSNEMAPSAPKPEEVA